MSAFWQDRPTLVTGGTGLLGSWLVRRLLDLGAEVVCLVRDWVPESELHSTHLIDRVRVTRGDVCDQTLMERTLGEYEVDTIFHLAAQTTVGVANRNPISTFQTNIQGTWTLLEACRRSPLVRQIVVASSDKAYGTHERLPYTEDTPLQGRHPYDVSKSCADLISQVYAATYGLPVAITRCGNLFGGGDLNWSRIVPGTIRSALRSQQPIIRSDGQSVRDYLYVEDAVAAYILLAQELASHRSLRGQAFNFSYEVQISVIEMAEQILSIIGCDLSPRILNEASNEIPRQFLSSAKSRETLGWRPLFSLEQGLRQTVRWYEEFLASSANSLPPLQLAVPNM